jgi:uncharacterized protein DUF29
MTYENDIYAWTQEQADALRRRAGNKIDYDLIAEEVEDMGASLLAAVKSHWRLALLHRLKAEAWPEARDVPHWQAEARLHINEAQDRYAPSMAQKIDLEKLYQQARRIMMTGHPASLDGVQPLPTPVNCPTTLDELLREDLPE